MNHREIEQMLLDPKQRPREELPHASRVAIRRAIAQDRADQLPARDWGARLAIAAMIALCASGAILTTRAVYQSQTPTDARSEGAPLVSPAALVRPLHQPYESEARAIRSDLESMTRRVLRPLRSVPRSDKRDSTF